jgi:hypothetical protein
VEKRFQDRKQPRAPEEDAGCRAAPVLVQIQVTMNDCGLNFSNIWTRNVDLHCVKSTL